MIAVNIVNTYTSCSGLWQYDYGQILRVQGLDLPTAVEIHFSLQEKGGETITRIGMSKDGATDVVIPDSLLENNNSDMDYKIFVFVYLTDKRTGHTEYKIAISVKSRPKPQPFDKPEDAELFREAIKEVNASAETAQTAAKKSESWAHGHVDYPDRKRDNAAYYATEAKNAAEGIDGRVEEGKRDIDKYVKEKEASLKGETGNVYFAAFNVTKKGRLIMYSDPSVDKIRFDRERSRLKYKLAL